MGRRRRRRRGKGTGGEEGRGGLALRANLGSRILKAYNSETVRARP